MLLKYYASPYMQLDPTLIHGHTIRLNETQKIDVQDAQVQQRDIFEPLSGQGNCGCTHSNTHYSVTESS